MRRWKNEKLCQYVQNGSMSQRVMRGVREEGGEGGWGMGGENAKTLPIRRGCYGGRRGEKNKTLPINRACYGKRRQKKFGDEKSNMFRMDQSHREWVGKLAIFQ